MKKTSKVLAAVLLCLAVLLSGCAHQAATPGTPAAPAVVVPVDVRIAQYNQILATANSNLVPVVASLQTAGIISAADAQKISVFQAAVATGTKGLAQILASTSPWADKAIQIQNLGLSLVPPAGYEKFGVSNPQEYQALVLAIDGMESTLKMVIQMAQTAPAPASE